jgi:hypothetical protein
MTLGNAFTQIGAYEDAIVQRVTAIVTSGALHYVTTWLFAAMALSLLILKCTGWALRGFKLFELAETLAQIMLTALLLAWFASVAGAIFNATLYIGQAMLAGLAGLSGNSPDAVSLPVVLVKMFVEYGSSLAPDCHVGWDPRSWLDCIKDGAVKFVAALAMSLVLLLLCIAIMLVDIWGFWLYAIALATGPVLLPFTLYKRLSFLFDGWLRFFFGAVVYVILARVNLGLVAVALLTFLHTTAQEVTAGGFRILPQAPIKEFADILGMLLFCGVGGFTLLATGRFASTIVAGAAAGGVDYGKAASPITSVLQR